jgi:hypothetical protein
MPAKTSPLLHTALAWRGFAADADPEFILRVLASLPPEDARQLQAAIEQADGMLRELRRVFSRALHHGKTVDAALGLRGRWREDYRSKERALLIAALAPPWDEVEASGSTRERMIRDFVAKAERRRAAGKAPRDEREAIAFRFLDASGGRVPSRGTVNKALPLARGHRPKPRDPLLAKLKETAPGSATP